MTAVTPADKSPQVPLATPRRSVVSSRRNACRNLTCHHCFISCSPHNDSFGFLTLDQVRESLEASRQLGVKEYYFTGGEPFLTETWFQSWLRRLSMARPRC